MAGQVMPPQPCADEDAALHRWLALTPELALEPELAICDPHHHLWDARAGEGGAHIVHDRPGGPVDPAAVSYGEPNPAGCQQRYLLDDVVADIRGSGHNVTHTCFVECGAMFSRAGPVHMRSLGETYFAQGTAAAAASGTYGTAKICAGITGTLDLSVAGAALEAALESFLSVPNFRGLRAGATDEGLALLEKHGVVFETGLGPDTARLARKFPALKIVVNHCCFRLPKDDDGGRSLAQWKEQFAEVARYPNVYAKVSTRKIHLSTRLRATVRGCCGVEITRCIVFAALSLRVCQLGGHGMPGFGFGWADRATPPSSEEVATATLPYYSFLIDTLGATRCMVRACVRACVRGRARFVLKRVAMTLFARKDYSAVASPDSSAFLLLSQLLHM
jgi:L-fuconolactonase